MTLVLTWLASASCETFLISSCGSTRLRCRVQSLSKTMPTSAMEHRTIGTMKMPPAFTISHMARIIPEGAAKRHSAPPVEGVTRQRDHPQLVAPRIEIEFDGALLPRIDCAAAVPAPAREHLRARFRGFDTAGSDSQSRRAGFYPLRRRTTAAGLAADEHDVAGQCAGRQAREQGALGIGIEVARQQQRGPPRRGAQHAMTADRVEGELHAIPFPTGIPAGRRRQATSGPAATHDHSFQAAFDC